MGKPVLAQPSTARAKIVGSIALVKPSTKSKSIIRSKFPKDRVDIGFKGLSVARLEGQPLVFHLVPEFFDAVEFRAVGRQEVKRQPLVAQQFEVRLKCFGGVDRSVV